jgi:hypothetical protein
MPVVTRSPEKRSITSHDDDHLRPTSVQRTPRGELWFPRFKRTRATEPSCRGRANPCPCGERECERERATQGEATTRVENAERHSRSTQSTLEVRQRFFLWCPPPPSSPPHTHPAYYGHASAHPSLCVRTASLCFLRVHQLESAIHSPVRPPRALVALRRRQTERSLPDLG